MPILDYRTAGESHGPALVALVEGIPAGLRLDVEAVNAALHRRQGGFGRGGRMRIEQDRVSVLSGLRRGVTLGSPIALHIENKDWRIDEAPPLHRPRPGHADFAGAMKWLTADCRDVLERASARETAARVAAGAVAANLLREFAIEAVGFTVQIGPVRANVDESLDATALRQRRDANEVYTPDPSVVDGMIEAIRNARADKDTVGGVVEVRVFGVPPGLGSCARWQDRLDGRLMGAVGAVQAIKGVELGAGFRCAELPGSAVHDPIRYDASRRSGPDLGFVRPTNHAGGLEGGMTNGKPIVVRAAMKPLSTLLRGADSVNLKTLQPERSDYERSDVCSVPAAGVVCEYVVAFEIARALLEKFAADTMQELRAALEFWRGAVSRLPQ